MGRYTVRRHTYVGIHFSRMHVLSWVSVCLDPSVFKLNLLQRAYLVLLQNVGGLLLVCHGQGRVAAHAVSLVDLNAHTTRSKWSSQESSRMTAMLKFYYCTDVSGVNT